VPHGHRFGPGLTPAGGVLLAGLLLTALLTGGAEGGEKEEGKADPKREEPVFRPKGEILRFAGFCVRDDSVRLYVDKIRGTTAPSSRSKANEIDFHARHSSVGLGARIEAGPLLGVHFRVGVLRSSLFDTLSGNSDLLPLTADSEVHETAQMDVGVEFGLGAELRFPVRAPLRLGALYEIGYGTAKVDEEAFFQSVLEGQYRYFTHLFQFFGDLPLAVEKPFKGFIRPRVGLGAFLYRASADLSSPDGTQDWDIQWIQDTGFLLTVSVHLETDGGLFMSLRGEFVGRTGFTAGMGIRF